MRIEDKIPQSTAGEVKKLLDAESKNEALNMIKSALESEPYIDNITFNNKNSLEITVDSGKSFNVVFHDDSGGAGFIKINGEDKIEYPKKMHYLIEMLEEYLVMNK